MITFKDPNEYSHLKGVFPDGSTSFTCSDNFDDEFSIDDQNKLTELLDKHNIKPTLILIDHVGGFDKNNQNVIFDFFDTYGKTNNVTLNIVYHNVLNNQVKKQYPNLHISFSSQMQNNTVNGLLNYNEHPKLNFKNLVCSFNGSHHVSRKLLVSILKKFNLFDKNYCSKNFVYTEDTLDGHIYEHVGDQNAFYRKFFIANDSKNFFETKYNFGNLTLERRYDHSNNIYNLENKLTESFLHIVSETMATSYHPFVTEKFLYSIVTRGLFLAYAQPGWHDHVEHYYGFRKYNRLFDYRFDAIQNPVERLVELVTMVSKFSILTPAEWHDLYLLEQDTIEYNYNHYFSGDYLKCLKLYDE
jgi:hypothetical protein